LGRVGRRGGVVRRGATTAHVVAGPAINPITCGVGPSCSFYVRRRKCSQPQTAPTVALIIVNRSHHL
jgi:hypothetical protein